ncbi:hypothetical protein BU17DRAFT_69961 [Hysterangium stoloniferum]|nr:hypothetical protein BU17DRAFT_69961 [Hysterangium stoloniferum]
MFGWTAVIVIVVALAATSRLVLILVLVLVWAVDLILVLVLVWGSCWPDVDADRDIFSDRDEEGSERHEHVEAEASTAMVNEDGHGDGVPRLQKRPVGLSVRLKMRMQTKANLNVDVAQSPTVPEYPYTFPRVPPSPSCPASNPPAAWAGGAMSIVQTMDANGHLQAHIHDHDTGKDPTIAQNDDNTHGDGGGGGMNMNESMESAQKPPRSPLLLANPGNRDGWWFWCGCRSGSASGPNTPTIRTISNGSTSIRILPSSSGPGRVLPAPAPIRGDACKGDGTTCIFSV